MFEKLRRTSPADLWPNQGQRSINLGFHKELRLSEAEYKATLPSFQTLPPTLAPELRKRFRIPLLVDPRVSLFRQLQLHDVFTDHANDDADITKLSLKELGKTHISDHPYLIWVSQGTFNEHSQTFQQNDRGLTGIEGLALLREHPNFFRFKVQRLWGGAYLTDMTSGKKIEVLQLEQTICADTTQYPEWVMTLYKCRYMHEPKTSIKAGVSYWDIANRKACDIVPCTLGEIVEK